MKNLAHGASFRADEKTATSKSGIIHSFTTVDITGVEIVLSGGTAVSTTVGMAVSTIVDYVGSEVVSSGGTTSFTTVGEFGGEFVFSGGTTSYTTVSGGGEVLDGGTTISTTVSGGNLQLLSVGDLAIGTTVGDNGVELVLRGSAVSTPVSSGGVEYVDGGTAVSTTFALGGVIDLAALAYASGGMASVTSGDVLSVTVGGDTYTQQLAGDYTGEYFQFTSGSGTHPTVLTLVVPPPMSTYNLTSGVTSSGITLGNGDFLYVSSGGTAISTTVGSGGTEVISSGGTASFTTVDIAGVEIVFSGGTAFSPIVGYVGSEVVSSGGTAIFTTVGNHGAEFVFSGGTTSYTLLSGDGEVMYGGTEYVSGGTAVSTTFALGGSIILPTLAYVPGGTAIVTTGDVLSVTVGGNTYTQQLAADYTGEHFQFTSLTSGSGVDFTQLTLVQDAPCYGSGTRILTDRGEVAVEDLRVGDLVQTVLGESEAPIVWIGRREVDCGQHPKPRKVWPVRVAAGAFGPGRPHSDLFLSPDPAVYDCDVLIPIRQLINGSTIAQMPVDCITYYHIELPRHEVVLAQGLTAESFLDLRNGSNYANRRGPVRLYPDFTARMWEAFGCARLIVAGPELAAARALVESFTKARAAA